MIKAKADFIQTKEALFAVDKAVYLSNPHTEDFTDSLHGPMVLVTFVNAIEGKKVKPGMKVLILPSMLSAFEHGHIQGEVVQLSNSPISKTFAYSLLGNMDLVNDFFREGPQYLVQIQLKQGPSQASGLQWTGHHGTDYAIQTGTIAAAKIIIKTSNQLIWSLENEI